MLSNPVRRYGGAAMLIFSACIFMLLFRENGSEVALGNDLDSFDIKTQAVRVQTTKLFWPFSSPNSQKVAEKGGKASKSRSVHSVESFSAKSVQSIDNIKMVSKAVREAQDVMRKLVLKDKEAARKAAEQNYLNDLVAKHIKEAQAAAQAKLAAAKSAIRSSKLAAEAKVATAKAVAKREQEQKLLHAQLCSRIAHKKPLTQEQCNAAIKLRQSDTELKSRKELELQQESEVLQKKEEESNLRLQHRIEKMARGLVRVDRESDDEALGKDVNDV